MSILATVGLLLPILTPLVPKIIDGVDQAFGRKNGPKKKEVSVNMASALVKGLRESGLFDDDKFDVKDVEALVQVTFDVMNSHGLVNSHSSADDGDAVLLTGTFRGKMIDA